MSTQGLRYAVVGATGAVGQAMLKVLQRSHLPIQGLTLAASERSAGKCLQFGGQSHVVQDLSKVDFSQVDIALFSAGGTTSKTFAPLAAEAGCVVIDNSSAFRYEEDVPLVVPEINADQIKNFTARNIIANPNCSTIAMLLAIQPIHRVARILRIDVATYQAVSGAGVKGITALRQQTETALHSSGRNDSLAPFPKPIAFNVLPQIGDFQANGYTLEEMKMVWETHKILDPEIEVNPSCARVPVFCGHSLAVHLHTEIAIDPKQAIDCLKSAPGVEVVDSREDGGYPTALTEADSADSVFVGRIRPALGTATGLNMWVVGDNILKGAALNAVQIAQHLAPLL